MAKRYLHLANGETFIGEAFGYAGEAHGEVVFTTAMTGYTESLTDPSYCGQILVFCYPLIGNYGVPKKIYQDTHLMENFESERIWAHAVIVGEHAQYPSHAASMRTFAEWLARERIPGISGIDTRELTQRIRDFGSVSGVITDSAVAPKTFTDTPQNLVNIVSCDRRYVYVPKQKNGKHVALIDCGVKHGIIRELLVLGYRVTRIPHDDDPTSVKHIDAVVCSNGPGDPKMCPDVVATIQRVLEHDIPYLGVCLGHQLLSLAIGADTYKLKFGHRGINQPCLDQCTNRAYVTSQNHGYAVKKERLPQGYMVWFTNLNDGTVEGIRHNSKPIRSTQFHPEGHPGPGDTRFVFRDL